MSTFVHQFITCINFIQQNKFNKVKIMSSQSQITRGKKKNSLFANLNPQRSSNRRKPQSFRMLFKSKSGIINQCFDNKSVASGCSQRGVQEKNNKINATEIDNENIRDFVRTMRNKTETGIQLNAGGNIAKQAKNVPSNEYTSSIERSNSVQEKPLNFSNTFSSFCASRSRRNLPIEQLQKKIDKLIEQKLSKTNLPQQKIYLEAEIVQIDKQIDEIVKVLQKQYTSQNNEQKLESINKKIDILEKIMAESMAQSELAKKHYSKKMNNHNQKYKKPPAKYKYDLNLLKNKIKNLIVDHNHSNTINLQSTNRNSFRAPDKSSYPEKVLKNVYQFRNQPIHRSTYGRDFLVFGSVPSYPFKQSPSQIIPSLTVGDRHSSYQNEFTKKKIERIDFKQLDCYKNKYKNVEVQFAELSNRSMRNEKKEKGQHQKVPKLEQIDSKRHKTQQSHYINNLSTENKTNYRGQNNNIRAEIKHKNLYNLKYTYKATMHA